MRHFYYILGCSQVGKAPDFDSGKTLSPVGSSPTTPAKQRLSSPLVVNNIKLATTKSLYPFFFAIVVDGEFQVVFTAYLCSGSTSDFQSDCTGSNPVCASTQFGINLSDEDD